MAHRERLPPDLSSTLATATLRVLATTYAELNAELFGDRLRPPVLELRTSTVQLGTWRRSDRTISLARSLVVDHGWGTIVEVLKHEMAHQFVDEVLQVEGETAHGRAFRETCRARGIDERAAGVPHATASEGERKVLERVAKLLALAESPNEHEAQAAALAAQRLMLKYNLDRLEAGSPREYGFRHLGSPTGRVSEAERILAGILAQHFFVEAIWVPVWRPLRGRYQTVLEVCGTPENLELAAYTHAFVLSTAEALWRERKRQLKTRRDTGRRQFLAGVMAGFADKLRGQTRQHQEQGLVWRGDDALEQFFRHRHPRIRRTYHRGGRRTEEFVRGREAGRQLVVHRGVSEGSSSQTPQLPPRGR